MSGASNTGQERRAASIDVQLNCAALSLADVTLSLVARAFIYFIPVTDSTIK